MAKSVLHRVWHFLIPVYTSDISRSSVPQRRNKCLKDREGDVSCIRVYNEPLLCSAFVYPFLVFMPRRRKECVMKKTTMSYEGKGIIFIQKKIQGGMIPVDPTLVAKIQVDGGRRGAKTTLKSIGSLVTMGYTKGTSWKRDVRRRLP
jgi:hypothetical protein